MKQKNLLMKCAPGHTLSVLKPVSFVVKWRCVVSVLSPLALKSYGGSHMLLLDTKIPICLNTKSTFLIEAPSTQHTALQNSITGFLPETSSRVLADRVFKVYGSQQLLHSDTMVNIVPVCVTETLGLAKKQE